MSAMEAHISPHFCRSGGDHFPPRLHKRIPHFYSSLPVCKSPSATIQNQFLRDGGATRSRLLKSSPPRNLSSVRVSVREDAPSLATVGVTGTVGQESLSDRSFRSLELASERSAGKLITFEDNDEEMTLESFYGVYIALFSAGGSISKEFGPIVVDSESIVVDNIAAFRMYKKDTARDILKNAFGVVDIDDRATPMEVSNKDDVAVGKICSDVSQDGNYGLDIFVCGGQIRKGATLNAVQIAEMLLIMMAVRHVYRSKCSEEVPVS